MNKIKDINDYISRSVTHIAREADCEEEYVWYLMAIHPHYSKQSWLDIDPQTLATSLQH